MGEKSEEMKKIEDKKYQPKFKSPKHEKKVYLKLEIDKLSEYLALSTVTKGKKEALESYQS